MDGLRGYAAVAVVFYHTILAPAPDLIPDVLHRSISSQEAGYRAFLKFVLATLNGEVAVYVFFVISGIVLLRALRAMDRDCITPGGITWRFLLRRALRIWPTMAVCLLMTTVLFHQASGAWPGTPAVPTLRDLGENLLLVRFPVHGATWTLFAELAAAPFLLLCFFAVRRFGPWAVLPFGAYAMVALLKYHGLLLHSRELIAVMPFLMAGVAIECGWLGPLARSRLSGLAAALGLAVLLATMLFVPMDAYKLRIGGLLLSIPVLVGFVHAAQDGLAVRILQAPPSRYLGAISFSLYLWNVPAFELLLSLAPDTARAHPLEAGLLAGLATLVVTWPIAHLSERWLERPCIRLGRMLTARGLGTPAPAALGRELLTG